MDVNAIWTAAWPYVGAVGYGYASGVVVGWVMFALRGRKKGDWRTAELGIVERALCFGAALAGTPEVIAGWLVFKVGSQWRRWTKQPGLFNTFAIGTVLNVAAGVSAGLLPEAIRSGNQILQDGLVGGPLLLCFLVYVQRAGPTAYRRLTDPGGDRRVDRPTADLPPP